MKSAESGQNWKHKYFSSLEELESKEKTWSELESLLKNTTLKMSVALDGLDYGFDKTLNDLRKILRGDSTNFQLQKIIHSITSGLDQIEKVKKSKPETSDTWKSLLSLSKSLKLPKTFTKQQKVINNTLLKCTESSDLRPILASLQKMLVEVLEYYNETAKQGGDKTGLMSKLFGKSSEHKGVEKKIDVTTAAEIERPNSPPKTVEPNENNLREAKTQAASFDIKEQQSSTDIPYKAGVDVIKVMSHKLNFNLTANSEIQAYAQKAEQISNGQSLLVLAEEFSKKINSYWPDEMEGQVASEAEFTINHALIVLLDKISLPVKFNQNITKLQSILEKEVKSKDWPILLDKIAKLISHLRDGVQKEKKELEKFLAKLTTRLQAIDNSIQGVDSDRVELHEESIRLNDVVSKEVADIRNQMQSKSEIEPLKVAIESRLDAIVTHMDSFKEHEEERNEKAEKTIHDLSSQLEVMEKESDDLRGKVAKQRKLAMMDRLTGVPNRMAYDERLDQEYRRWRRFHDSLSLVVIDIDLFKKVNDNFGHKAGDKVLSKVAEVINERIRETDFLARFGGEEFVVLMTGAKLGDAMRVANELREAVNACAFHFRDEDVPVTISAGVAEFIDNDTPDDVFERADKAMYRAKEGGRNKCCS